jgi:hypothetical protein
MKTMIQVIRLTQKILGPPDFNGRLRRKAKVPARGARSQSGSAFAALAV